MGFKIYLFIYYYYFFFYLYGYILFSSTILLVQVYIVFTTNYFPWLITQICLLPFYNLPDCKYQVGLFRGPLVCSNLYVLLPQNLYPRISS